MAQLTELVDGLSGLAPHFDLLLCDVWGVVHNGVKAHPAACAALARFRAGGGQVVLVSNAPRPGSDVVPQLRKYGVTDDAWDDIVTSGDVARALISERPGQMVRLQGPERDLTLLEGLDAPLGPVEKAAYIVCTGFEDDEIQTPEDYAEELAEAARRGLVMICANPDLVVERGHKLIPCAGAMALAYEKLGGRTIYTGKPHGEIYRVALDKAARRKGAAIDQRRMACVGDAIRTDVAGAAGLGVPALMVLKGIHAADLFDEAGQLLRDGFEAWVADQSHRPRYAIPELVW